MGVINVTPDSFSDGGQYINTGSPDLGKILHNVEVMLEGGAALIDIGGESTRPGATAVSTQEEIDRTIPVIEHITSRLDTIISIDTSNPLVMSAAVDAGAGLINDVRALTRSGALSAASKSNVPICLMHISGDPENMQTKPEYKDVVVEVKLFLKERINACIEAGISKERLILDPGIGFGKTLEHNLKLLRHLRTLISLGFPVLVGISRKSMIGQILKRPISERIDGSVGAAVAAVMNGAAIIRCHDVRATNDALCVASAIANG